ncbi:DUF4136 domain-containing protein [Sphingomonas sp. S2-65]|uniref:DUF4136 domain-containing protein n=1 Tax=Sphingomonas sp. S2-65 TaxID=2903960 RepID=UPI001F26068B|nr:DUF4136 domain-containing protein [Sphingomonas sp. S2-65]UYY57650.1 DUF4136 domain-containing protein [Sphingomonas sp. S2-65]
MTKPIRLAVAAVAATLLAGCATTPRQGPVDVTRYHLGQPMERTTVAIEPLTGGGVMMGPEFQTYAGAVGTELARLGYVQSTSSMPSAYIAVVSFRYGPRGTIRQQSPFSIGLGGGGFSGGRGGGVGLGGGVNLGLGGKTRDVIGTELSVQLRRRSDNSTIWEGRAITESVSGTPGSDPRDQAARLSRALFRDFPGESGVTTTVK